MTIMEMMVGLTIAGIGALGFASLMGSIGGTGNDAELIVEKTQFASSLGVYLNSSFGCNDLKSAPMTASFTGAEQEIKLDRWKYLGVGTWKSETQFSEKLKDKVYLKKLTAILQTTPIPPATALPTVNLTYLNAANATVTENLNKTLLKVRAVIEMKKREYIHEFLIPVLMTSSNDLRFCGDNQTLAATCAALSGQYNPVTGECKLKETCQTMGSYIDLTCTPRVNGGCDISRGIGTVNPLTSGNSCPFPSQPVSTGADSWDDSPYCGKKCDDKRNNSLGYYSCLYCP